MILRHRALTVFLFVSVFLAGLFTFAPAALVGYALERASGGMLSLAQTQGSLWQGTGVLVMKHKARHQTLGAYRWKLQLWRGAMQVQAGDDAPMTFRLHPLARRIDIDALHVRFPATTLELLSAQLGPYQLQGMFDAHAEHIALEGDSLNGQVTVDWKQAASGLSPIRPLGDYRIVLQGRQGAVDAQLGTTTGKLILNAKGSYDMARGLQLNGTAQAAPEAVAELSELLHHIGPETSPGVYSLALMPAAR